MSHTDKVIEAFYPGHYATDILIWGIFQVRVQRSSSGHEGWLARGKDIVNEKRKKKYKGPLFCLFCHATPFQ